MTVFFNLENIEKEVKYDPYDTLNMLQALVHDKLMPRELRRKLTGLSYLLKPGPLFEFNNVDILHKIQYIKLAARRDYTMYKLYNYRDLNLSYFPDINLKTLRSNPLLIISNTQIKFIHEG